MNRWSAVLETSRTTSSLLSLFSAGAFDFICRCTSCGISMVRWWTPLVAYLRFKAAGDLGGFARQGVEEALGSCWLSETG
jgi:hypothetical protein